MPLKIQTMYRNVSGSREREVWGDGGGEKEEHVIKATREDYSLSPGKMQPRSGQSCEEGNGMKGCKENELERLTEVILQKPMTGFDP